MKPGHGLSLCRPYSRGGLTTKLDVDLTALSVGKHTAAAFLSATGLTFTRTTVSTVQTSASTIDSTPGVDEACIGDRTGSARGLVIQQNTRNKLGAAAGNSMPRAFTAGAGWLAGSGSTVTNTGAGPDGTVAADTLTVALGQYAVYHDSLSSSRETISCWLRSDTTSDMQLVWMDGAFGAANAHAAVATGTTTWQRLHIAKGTATRRYACASDGRDYSAAGGQTARARAVRADFFQYEDGDFPSEAIATGNTRRANDRLSYSTGSALTASNGQLRFWASFYPKHSTTMDVYYDGSGGAGTSASWYLFSHGTGATYARINASTKRLEVRAAGGGVVTSTNAVSWSQYDQVDIFVSFGAGAASVAKCRVNGGAWSDLVLASVAGSPAASGAVAILSGESTPTADSGQLPCWLRNVRFYDSGDPTT